MRYQKDKKSTMRGALFFDNYLLYTQINIIKTKFYIKVPDRQSTSNTISSQPTMLKPEPFQSLCSRYTYLYNRFEVLKTHLAYKYLFDNKNP